MTETLLIALAIAVLVALVILIQLVRRKPPEQPGVNPDQLQRLMADAVATSLSQAKLTPPAPGPADQSETDAEQESPAVPGIRSLLGRPAQTHPDLDTGSIALERARLTDEIAAEAAALRDAATKSADELRTRSEADANRLRLDARAEADRTISAAREEAGALRANLAEERRRLLVEATATLAAEREEVQAAQLRLRSATDSLIDDRKSLAAERERSRGEQDELTKARADLAGRAEALKIEAQRLEAREHELAEQDRELAAAKAGHEAELSRIAGLTTEAARAELLASQEEQVRRDAAFMIRRVQGEAEVTAQTKARAIVAEAIQRVASDQTAQTVVSVVHLPADEVKGRIIGREGRNIRAFETVTGVNVIIDDTPEAVLLSCFDPVRREIGRVTLEMLIEDGRIHPHRIEEAYERAHDEVDALCRRAAEDALLDVGISDVHPELVHLLGRLKYRTSYGQNVLGHLVETAHIARVMAAELGIAPEVAARGAFLHDIGKALTHEVQGSHALIGAELARKYGESDDVVHCIEAHHNEVAPSTVEAVLTQAADACSGGRPGARRESLESYVQRLERIEAIAVAKKGVEKVFAMQAGRELRVMVKPEVVDDLEAHVIAREVAKQIEEELTYPGQVRVTVIRESRATEVAR